MEEIPNDDDKAKGVKRKHFRTSFIDSIINMPTEEYTMAPQTKIICFGASISKSDEENDASGRFKPESSLKRTQNMNSDHTFSKIPPTERKKWPQKPCVQCQKSGFRHDTRYICTVCNAALCKEPCFSQYHCNK